MKRTKHITTKISYIKKVDVFILVTVFTMFIILVISNHNSTNMYKESQLELIQESMEILAGNQEIPFENYISDKVEVLSGLTAFPDIYSMDQKRQRSFLYGRSKGLGFHHIFVMDTEGMAFYIDENVVRDQHKELFFDNVMYNDIYITEPFYGGGLTLMTISVSIYNDRDEKIGVLCGAIELDQIQEVCSKNSLMLDGDSFLVNRQGVYLATEDMQKVYNKASIYKENDSDYSLVRLAFAAKDDKTGTIIRNGVEYQATVQYLKNYDWAIVQCISTEAILEDINYIELWQTVSFVIMIIIVLCIIKIAFYWRRSERRIGSDTLTGCNSRAAMEVLIKKLENETHLNITIVYLDLNKFKHINDTYGHDVGDRVLCVFSQILEEVFCQKGYVGRMGGDEFMTVLFDTTEDEVLEMCKNVNVRLSEESRVLELDCIISSSYGYATRAKGESLPLQPIINKADENMYKFKEQFSGKH